MKTITNNYLPQCKLKQHANFYNGEGKRKGGGKCRGGFGGVSTKKGAETEALKMIGQR